MGELVLTQLGQDRGYDVDVPLAPSVNTLIMTDTPRNVNYLMRSIQSILY